MRVNVQLLDAETASHIWAERFDKPVADLFDMQDEIVSRLANALGQELARAEAGRAERAANPNSMDHFFLGYALLNKGVTADIHDKARFHFDRALELDPDNVDALVGSRMGRSGLAAIGCPMTAASGCSPPRPMSAKRSNSGRTAQHAHCALGAVRIYSNRAVQGIAECERALAIDRNLAVAHGFIGMAKIFSGCNEETEAHILEALRISPRDELAWVWMVIAGISQVPLGSRRGSGRMAQPVDRAQSEFAGDPVLPRSRAGPSRSHRRSARGGARLPGNQSELHDRTIPVPDIKRPSRSISRRASACTKACARREYPSIERDPEARGDLGLRRRRLFAACRRRRGPDPGAGCGPSAAT